MRHLIFLNAKAIDEARHGSTDGQRAAGQELADLLTPLSKAWCTDLGNELCSIAVQLHGGMGFCEDTGVAQLFRDVRIAAIYEGTNGIQALDLYGRKLGLRGGAVVGDLIDRMRADLRALSLVSPEMAEELASGIAAAESLTKWMLGPGRDAAVDGMAGATPYLRVIATVVGGWLMGKQAVIASSSLTDPYCKAKFATSSFYIRQVLTTIHGLTEQITAGAEQLFAIPVDQLASR